MNAAAWPEHEAIARPPVVRRALAVLVPEAVRQAAEVLAPRGIPVMPLKGAVAQHWLYGDPSERLATDADLLVTPEAFEPALACLRAAGFGWRGEVRGQGQAVLLAPCGVAVDLHAFPLGPWRFPGCSARRLFERARLDRDLFGVPVWLPHPEDFVLHLVGKLVLDRVGPGERLGRWTELAEAPLRLGLSADGVASRADRLGLQRALRYVARAVLVRGHQVVGGGSATRSWWRRLSWTMGADPMGDLLATGMAHARPGPTRVLAAYALEDTAPSAVWRLLRRLGAEHGRVTGRMWRRSMNARASRGIRQDVGVSRRRAGEPR